MAVVDAGAPRAATLEERIAVLERHVIALAETVTMLSVALEAMSERVDGPRPRPVFVTCQVCEEQHGGPTPVCDRCRRRS